MITVEIIRMTNKQTILITGATGNVGEVRPLRWQNVALALYYSDVGSKD